MGNTSHSKILAIIGDISFQTNFSYQLLMSTWDTLLICASA